MQNLAMCVKQRERPLCSFERDARRVADRRQLLLQPDDN